MSHFKTTKLGTVGVLLVWLSGFWASLRHLDMKCDANHCSIINILMFEDCMWLCNALSIYVGACNIDN